MSALEAKQSALETVYKLSYALDRLNYHELAALFYPDKTFNFDIYAILKKPASDVTIAEYFEIGINGLGGFDATQHLLSNPIVTIDNERRAHVRTMVTAFHALKAGANIEGATARVTWDHVLEQDGQDKQKWYITKWVIQGLVPIDRPDLFEQGHKRAHDGQLRASIVRP